MKYAENCLKCCKQCWVGAFITVSPKIGIYRIFEGSIPPGTCKMHTFKIFFSLKIFYHLNINVERDLAASSSLWRNKNSDYLKMDDSINNRNNKTTRFNVARDNNINCIIYKFIQKYGFKAYFYDNISIKSNVSQRIRKFIVKNYYYKSSKENTTRKSKKF